MKRIPLLLALLVAFLEMGCDNAIESAYQEQIVVAGFLYAGHPIDSIVLHRTTPFGAYYNDLDYAVDSAKVTITVDGVDHTLLPSALKGRYYLPASELVVEGGKTYTLSIVAPNHQTGGVHTITASTKVPMPIKLSSIADSIRGKTFVVDTANLSNFAFVLTASPVESPSSRYLLTVRALDTTYGRFRVERPNADSDRVVRYSLVQTGPAIAVIPQLISFFGPQLITFYSIDTNWVDYQRQAPPFGGTDYQPSLNHVVGGMGIFGSGSGDTVSVFLKPKE